MPQRHLAANSNLHLGRANVPAIRKGREWAIRGVWSGLPQCVYGIQSWANLVTHIQWDNRQTKIDGLMTSPSVRYESILSIIDTIEGWLKGSGAAGLGSLELADIPVCSARFHSIAAVQAKGGQRSISTCSIENGLLR